MNARYAKGLPWFLCALLMLGGAGRSAADPWGMGPGQFTTQFSGGKSSAQSIFDGGGNNVAFAQGGTWQSLQAAWSTELGWKKHTSILIGIPLSSTTRRYAALNDSIQTRTGLVDLSLGIKYQFFRGPTALALTAAYEAPMGYDRWLGVGTRSASSGSDQVLSSPRLGAGHQNLRALIEFGKTLGAINSFFQVGGGMRLRVDGNKGDDEPQSELLSYGDYGLWVGKSVLVAASYLGRRERGAATDPQDEHLLGPRVVFRVDDHFDIYAGSFHSLWGKNVRNVDQFYVGLTAKKTSLNRLQGFFGTMKNP